MVVRGVGASVVFNLELGVFAMFKVRSTDNLYKHLLVNPTIPQTVGPGKALMGIDGGVGRDPSMQGGVWIGSELVRLIRLIQSSPR